MYRSRLSAFTECITEMVVVLGLPHTCVVFVPDRVAADGEASGGDELQRGRGKPGGESGAFFWRQQRSVVARAELVRPHDELAARGQRLSKGICEAKRENRYLETYATLVSSALRTHRTHMTLNRGAEGRARALPPPPLQGGLLFLVYFLGLPPKRQKNIICENHFSNGETCTCGDEPPAARATVLDRDLDWQIQRLPPPCRIASRIMQCSLCQAE